MGCQEEIKIVKLKLRREIMINRDTNKLIMSLLNKWGNELKRYELPIVRKLPENAPDVVVVKYNKIKQFIEDLRKYDAITKKYN